MVVSNLFTAILLEVIGQKDDLNQKEAGAYTFAISRLYHRQAGGIVCPLDKCR
jgi:hypothetical protein